MMAFHVVIVDQEARVYCDELSMEASVNGLSDLLY